ncbi:hypothetical protein ACTFIR_004053 [Dictyostelium discoideum]
MTTSISSSNNNNSNSNINNSQNNEIIHFTSLGYGELRLAKKYSTKDILDDLFQTEGGLIVVDGNGEEYFPDEDNNYDLVPNKTYTIVSEKDLDSDTDESDDEDNADEGEDETHNEKHDNDNENDNDHEHEHHQHEHKGCCNTDGHHEHDNDNEDSQQCCSKHHNATKSELKRIQNSQNGFNKLLKMREARINMISKLYERKYPEIFELREEYFDKDFIEPIKQYKKTKNQDDLLKALTKLTETRIYSFRIFTMEFCTKLLEEMENFKNTGLPTARPNSMNNYGAVLDEMGFTEFFKQLREDYLSLFTSILYKDYNGEKLNSHHAFAVQYKMDKEKELGFHYDESDITVNLCLGSEFTGGSLYFKGILDKPETHNEYFEFKHVPGVALIHIGVHRHGALGLTSGERTNLILWLRNSNIVDQQSESKLE